MAEVIVPITGKAGVFQISPTITSMAFYGKDDNLFRINRTTRDNAQDYAKVMVGLGQRKIAVAYDTRNRNFTESWLNEFRTAIATEKAAVAVAVPYESATDTDFAQVIGQMLAANPDSLFFISGALDVARFAQAAREQSNCPSGAEGGHLGWLTTSDCAPEFAKELFGHAEIGVLPRLVHTRFGLHVVEVMERKAGVEPPFDEVRGAVAMALRQKTYVTALRQYLNQLAGQAEIVGVAIDAADTPLVQ